MDNNILEQYNKAFSYWEKKLSEISSRTVFELINKSIDDTNEYKEFSFSIKDELFSSINKICKNDESLVFVFMLTIFKVQMDRYSFEGNKTIALPLNIQSKNMHNNDFIPFICNGYMEKNFKELIYNVKNELNDMYLYQDIPLKEVMRNHEELSNIETVTDISFAMRNIHSEDALNPLIALENNKFTFVCKLEKEEIIVNILYRSSKDMKQIMLKIQRHFEFLIKNLLENANVPIGKLQLLEESDLNILENEFNNTSKDWMVSNKTLHQLFEEQVHKTPENIAVVFDNEKISYRELDERANALAEILISKGCASDSIIGIALDKSIEMIIAMLAVLKADGAYLPIDPEAPYARVEKIIEECDTKILLIAGNNQQFKRLNVFTIDINEYKSYYKSTNILKRRCSSNNLAYVIFTSGSTGTPKGVMVEHKSIINTLLWRREYYEFNEKDSVLQIPAYYFDSSVEDIFTALISGAKLVMMDKDKRIDVNYVSSKIKEEQVTHFLAVPNFYKTLLPYIYCHENRIKKITVAGEAFTKDLVEEHYSRAPGVRLINEYGPTENSVCSTVYEFSEERNSVLMGKPINNVKCYVLDKSYRVSPVGIVGELYLSGSGLARGYVNSEKLSSEKFVNIPHLIEERLYRTGDLARWTLDGNLEFIGRIDQQVKIRGYRVELGEIESALLSIDGINECVVTTINEGEDKAICAYYVGYSKVCEEIKDEISKKLPSYMHPKRYVQLPKLPVNKNGKIDRKALPKIEINMNEYIAPRNSTEEVVVKIFSDVLKIDKVSIRDDFFELGGHSLKVTRLIVKLKKDLNVTVSLMEVFNNPTVEGLSAIIDAMSKREAVKIEKSQKREFYPLSSAQARIYNIQNIKLSLIAYNLPVLLLLKGNTDKGRLEGAFKSLIKRHAAFRTSFEIVDEVPMQRIHDTVDFSICYKEIEEESLIKAETDRFIQPFNLSQAPLMRALLIKQSNDRHYLMVDMHHIISDGTSAGVIVDEFTKLYNLEDLDELELEYVDFAVWQQEQKQGQKLIEKEKYWRNIFSGELPVLNLPIENVRPSVQTFDGETIYFEIDKELKEKLNRLARKYNTTLFTVLFTSFNVLVHKLSGQEDIIVGVPTTGRNYDELKRIVGMFVNTLAIRSQPEKNKSFAQYLNEMKEITLGAFENQDFQFDDLLEVLNLKRDKSRNPIFDVMFAHQNIEINHFNLENLEIEFLQKETKISKFDLLLQSFESSDKIAFTFEYNVDLFNDESAKRMIGYYQKILSEICVDNEITLEKINILSGEERKKILHDFNETLVDFANNKKIHQLFEEQVARTPNFKAISCGDRSLTYKELNELANSVAHTLIAKGFGRDKIIALLSYNSIETLIGILAVLKAGGAYLPIDPKIPEERIHYIIKDSKVKLLLVGEGNLIRHIEGVEVLNLKDGSLYENSTLNIKSGGSTNELAYVIYTSGTTGKPKGVMIEHRNVVNYAEYSIRQYFGKERHVVPLYSSIGFDLTVTALFPPLLHGDEIIVYRDNDINRVMSDNRSTLIKVTPAHLELIKNLNNRDSSVKIFIVGGEELKIKLAQEVFNSFNGNIEIYNEYGPTETTVGCTVHKYDYSRDQKNNLTIGKPIQNDKVYILDKANCLCPLGVVGELCIGGVGVGRGYLYNDTLTNEKFIENPFIKGERIYRTGDLTRWNHQGTIDFLGRIDNQIKIRGFRIELSEIENVMLKVEGISEAVVLVVEKDEEKLLCVYYVGETGDIEYIKDCLSRDLPDYMIPMYFIKLDKIPLNQNGKVDRRELPLPEYISSNYIAPRNALEESLHKIFCEILKLDELSITDDFFELGGHSLKAMDLVARIKSSMNTTISLMDIFEIPTIEKLAAFIASKDEEQYYVIEKAVKREYYPLSSAQKRIFVLQNLEPDSIAYNIPSILILNGEVTREKIEYTFRKLINRHEAFRTSFKIIDENPVQKIWEEVDFNITYERIEDENNVEMEIKKFIKAFDLEKAPLLRIALIEINPQKHILMIDMHHIISDGSSSEIIINEFTRLYNDEELINKNFEYTDYAVWQNSQMSQNKLTDKGEYWKSVLAGDLPVLKLNTDFLRPSLQSFEGEAYDFYIDEDLSADLRRFGKENDATLFMVLLAGFKILLYKYSGQEDIIVGTPVSGRNRTELLNIVGMFVNVLPIRSYPIGNKKVKEFLGELKKTTIEAFDNQDFQFEDLIEVLNVRRDTSCNPIFDVMFSLENTENKDISIDSIKIEDYSRENTISKFDLTLNALENKDNIYFSFEYCKKLFKKDTIERMAKHYINILKEITHNSDMELNKLDLLTSAEKEFFNKSNISLCEYPKDKTFYMLFEERVEKNPENIAVACKDKTLTYRELNSKANQLARHLRKIGVEKESKVAILLDRGLEMIIAVLGVMKSGGAYVPLDEAYPDDRINFILNDCEAMALIKKGTFSHSLTYDGEIIDMNDDSIWENDSENLTPISFGDNLIYLIYTSGTTGNPKGVMLEHRNITNIAFAWKKDYKLEEMEVNILQFASFSFDVFCGDLCRALLNGGKLVICSREERLDIEALYSIITKHKISIFESTPALIVELMKYIYENNLSVDSLKLLILGSDVCKAEDFKKINHGFGKKMRILNSYGLTETAIDSSFFEMDNSEELHSINVPIGKPMQNNKFYILDKNLNYLPTGVCGELYIGGEGVARGYVNNEVLTSERFIKNPFVKGERLYKTGDLARWLADGNVEFVGRKDTQVKIRGFRIEISEIENVLITYSGIDEAAVIPVEINNDLHLCGYYAAKTDDITVERIKKFLSGILPHYMIPSYFIQLEKMPLSANGKIDKKALRKPDESILMGAEYEAPRNDLEEKLTVIWQEVLEIERVGICDNFFELGGHSLKAILLIGKIHKELEIEISLSELFRFPTIKEISSHIVGLEKSIYSLIPKAIEQQYYPLSSSQQRLFILHELNRQDISYNMPIILEVEGNIDLIKLENSFKQLIERHEIFRTTFKFLDGAPVQIINKNYDFKVNIINTKSHDIDSIIDSLMRPFNLSELPIIRANLINAENQKQILMIDMHHIISDGISMEIIIDELADLYNGNYVKDVSIQYKDFSLWQKNYLSSDNIKKHEYYWLEKTKDFNYTRFPKKHTDTMCENEGACVQVYFNKEDYLKIKNYCAENLITKFTYFMAILNIILMNEIGKKDLVVGVPVAGRNHDQLQDVIGLFLNVLLIRTNINENSTLKEYVEEVNNTLVEALNHQDYPYEELFSKLAEKYSIKDNSLFSIMLNYMPYEGKAKEDVTIDGLILKQYESSKISPKYDMTVYVKENQEDIFVDIVYRCDEIEGYVVERMAKAFENISNVILQDHAMLLKDIEYGVFEAKEDILLDDYFENEDLFNLD